MGRFKKSVHRVKKIDSDRSHRCKAVIGNRVETCVENGRSGCNNNNNNLGPSRPVGREIHRGQRDGLGDGTFPRRFASRICVRGRPTVRRRPVRPGERSRRGRQSTAAGRVPHVQVRPNAEPATQPFAVRRTVSPCPRQVRRILSSGVSLTTALVRERARRRFKSTDRRSATEEPMNRLKSRPPTRLLENDGGVFFCSLSEIRPTHAPGPGSNCVDVGNP